MSACIGFVTIQNNIVLKLLFLLSVLLCCFVTIQNNIVLKRPSASGKTTASFVTIQNNIVLKQALQLVRYCMCFVTIQNNIVLKPECILIWKLFRFVTIQNNIVLKPQSLKNVILNAITIHILQNHCPYIKYVRMKEVVHILHVPMLIRLLHYTQHTYIFQPILLFQSKLSDWQI